MDPTINIRKMTATRSKIADYMISSLVLHVLEKTHLEDVIFVGSCIYNTFIKII